jgi:MFS family permease
VTATDLRAGFASSFRALRHRDFRRYWTGQLVSLVGTWMQSVAQGWLMHRLTDSPFMLGMLGFAQFLPVLLFSLGAGVVVDRMDRRRLLQWTQSLAMAQAVLLAVLAGSGWVQPWMVLALAFAFGTINAFDLPARQSLVVDLVGREDLANGIALNAAAFNAARIVGPAVAGVLVAWVGEVGCFAINALSYLAVLAGLARMRFPEHRPEVSGSAWERLREGLDYAWRTRAIRHLLVLLAIMGGFGFQYMVLLPVYARTILHAGAGEYGLMVSAFGLGSLLAAARMTQRLSRWDLRRHLLLGLVVAGLGQAGFAWSRALPLTLVMGFLSGFGLILYISSTNTLVQMTTDDAFRGRVMSLYTFGFVGMAPFGALLAGSLAQRYGAPVATSVCALLLLAGALWVSVRLRELAAREAAPAGGGEPEPLG